MANQANFKMRTPDEVLSQRVEDLKNTRARLSQETRDANKVIDNNNKALDEVDDAIADAEHAVDLVKRNKRPK